MRTVHRNFMLTFGAGAGAMLAAAFLPTAVATADDYDLVPDTSTFVPHQVEGFPPLINEVTGAEDWNIYDATTHTTFFPDLGIGTDTQTTIGSFINDDFLVTEDAGIRSMTEQFDIANGTQIDLANFGLGFENEWMDIPSGANAGVSDLFITPFGNFEILGTGFSDLSAVIASV
jgi:hypothetical protein